MLPWNFEHIDGMWQLIINFVLQASDRAEPNAHRFERLWHEHVEKNSEKSSLSRVMWRFCRTRCIVAMLFMVFAVIFQFLGPVS